VSTVHRLETADEDKRIEALCIGAHEAPSRDWRRWVCPATVNSYYAPPPLSVK
jgi:hypothetical protein